MILIRTTNCELKDREQPYYERNERSTTRMWGNIVSPFKKKLNGDVLDRKTGAVVEAKQQ